MRLSLNMNLISNGVGRWLATAEEISVFTITFGI